MKIALCGLQGDSSCVLCWGSFCGRASPWRENKKMARWGFWALKLCFIRAQNQNTPDLLGEMDWLQTNLPLLGRLFSSSSLALGPAVFGFHQSHTVTSLCAPGRNLIFWCLCGSSGCLALGACHPALLLLHLLGPSCLISPGQECSAAAISPSLQGSSRAIWHWFPYCCQPQVLKQSTPCPHHQLQTNNKPDILPSACWLRGFQSLCVPARWLLIFWPCSYLRVSLFISEREKKEVISATTRLTTWSKELFFSPLSFISFKDFSKEMFTNRITFCQKVGVGKNQLIWSLQLAFVTSYTTLDINFKVLL